MKAKKILTRLLGLITYCIMFILCAAPFLIAIITHGLNKANIFMSSAMRLPMNWLLGDGLGDFMLDVHKAIYRIESHKTN